MRGISADSKDKSGALMSWDTPLAGLVAPIAERRKPLTRHWARIRSESGRPRALSPHVNPGRGIDVNRDATFAVAKAQLPRVEDV